MDRWRNIAITLIVEDFERNRLFAQLTVIP